MNDVLDITSNHIINEDISSVIKNNINLIDLNNTYEILITGANGMLPSYLLYFFQGLNIISENRFNISVVIRNNTNRIEIINNKSKIEIIANNIEKPITTTTKFDYIIHAASDATPKKYLKEKVNTINTNVKGLYNLLDLDTSKLKSFMLFSTAELYGNPSATNIPTKEDVIGTIDHLNERSAYVETKKFCETLCMNYFFERGLPVKIIRPFHTFGPGLDIEDGRVFSDFTKSAIKLTDIIIESDGQATRSFCYLSDALDMFVKVLFSKENGQVYNIGNPNNETSIGDLAKIVCELTNKDIQYKILGKPNNGSPNRSCPNITKGIEKLGFNPTYNTKDSFKRTILSL